MNNHKDTKDTTVGRVAPRAPSCRTCDGRGYTVGIRGVFTCTDCGGSGEAAAPHSALRTPHSAFRS